MVAGEGPGGDTDGTSVVAGPPAGITGTIEQMRPASVIRVAAVVAVGFGGIVLLAIGLGAVAGRLATPSRVFMVATLVACAAALAGGMLAEPVLRRWAARARRGGQVDLGSWSLGRA